jgi:hypothetical protein
VLKSNNGHAVAVSSNFSVIVALRQNLKVVLAKQCPTFNG